MEIRVKDFLCFDYFKSLRLLAEIAKEQDNDKLAFVYLDRYIALIRDFWQEEQAPRTVWRWSCAGGVSGWKEVSAWRFHGPRLSGAKRKTSGRRAPGRPAFW